MCKFILISKIVRSIVVTERTVHNAQHVGKEQVTKKPPTFPLSGKRNKEVSSECECMSVECVCVCVYVRMHLSCLKARGNVSTGTQAPVGAVSWVGGLGTEKGRELANISFVLT